MPEIPGFQSFTPTTTLVLALVPLLYFIVRPALLHLLTPKPLPGIPYRKGRQYPIIGDGLDAGKWLREQATITQWFDGCIQAFMYGGDERGSQWGVLDGKRTAKEMISDFAASDLKRNSGYEGICQMMFGFGHGARQVAVTDVDETHNILTKRTAEFERAEYPRFGPNLSQDRSVGIHLIFAYDSAWERAVVRGDERAELADCAIDQALLKDGTVDALSEPELRDEVLLFLVAGQETIARTLSWGMKMLSRAPDVQKRLKKELTEAGLLEREITYNDLLTEKVPYLEATTQEILRLAGTAAGVSRIATRDTTVLGKHIPKGTTLYFPLALMAHLPVQDLAGDSRAGRTSEGKWKGDTLRKFVPERWLDGEGQFDGQVGVQSLPFSAGQRGCFGKALAVLELKTMLAKINLAFFLESIPSEYDSDEFVEYISRKPKVSYVRPVPW
ncbi:hypothetical protein QFC19_001476 [Naganishia cerealis]|uniref:Uncharacterized protein n=1 Tax=Naganishia cerealis TaxID=610337 RepID=A0ACC2WG63_9TREE|nr:hypothetical protein QFC19_001476 [Naganishia cerealis]